MMQADDDRSFYDAVVVGAGPAGSMTALELARRGASVLLVDRSAFPRDKVCGCCVNPRALSILGRAGLGDLAARLDAVPLASLRLGCGGRQATLRYPLGVAVSRAAFDAALVDAARGHGAGFLPETTASLLPDSPRAMRALRLRGEGCSRTVHARFVVSATGLSDSLHEGRDGSPAGEKSLLRPRVPSRVGAGAICANVPDGYPPGQISMACGPQGYVGLVVLEDGRLDLAAALCPAAIRRLGGIGPLVERTLAGAGFPAVPGVADLSWKGTPLLTRRARTVAAGRIFRVGDSAGYVEPFTGEGIAWALAGGQALARLIGDALPDGLRSPERAWIEVHRREVVRSQRACRSTRLVLRVPWLARSLVRILNVHPGLARPLLRSMHRTRLGSSTH